MKLYFKCICCGRERFIIDKSSLGDLCGNCFGNICTLDEISDNIILFYARNKDELKELKDMWKIPNDRKLRSVSKMNKEFTTKEKELIAKFFRDRYGIPDKSGFVCSMFHIDEDIMIVYRRLFPNDWERFNRNKTIKKYPTYIIKKKQRSKAK